MNSGTSMDMRFFALTAKLPYLIHFDAVYLTKRTIYLIMAVIGLINWGRLNRDRNKENA